MWRTMLRSNRRQLMPGRGLATADDLTLTETTSFISALPAEMASGGASIQARPGRRSTVFPTLAHTPDPSDPNHLLNDNQESYY